jgi:hypothetical protein
MRSKLDPKIEAHGRKRKGQPKPLPGGKVLQRLFSYLAERDPTLSDDVVATMPVPKAVRPRFALTARAMRPSRFAPMPWPSCERGRPRRSHSHRRSSRPPLRFPQPDAKPVRRVPSAVRVRRGR